VAARLGSEGEEGRVVAGPATVGLDSGPMRGRGRLVRVEDRGKDFPFTNYDLRNLGRNLKKIQANSRRDSKGLEERGKRKVEFSF
jgi:hypothetical protein